MWCSTCQQEVPGVAHAVSGRIVCSRCRRPGRTSNASHAGPICDGGIALDEPAAALAAAAPPFRGDDWSARHRVRRISRDLHRSSPAAPLIHAPAPHRRFDPPADLFDQLEQATAPNVVSISPHPATKLRRVRRSEASQVLIWIMVLTGATALGAGIGLIVWSLTVNDLAYWSLALGLSLGGQGILILGLMLVVTRLWRSSRHAAGKLSDVHARLSQLQHTADAVLTTRSGGAPAFYADLVRGASPQMLLANLKGQLDQLAARLGGR